LNTSRLMFMFFEQASEWPHFERVFG
jgi:hypothetical protein